MRDVLSFALVGVGTTEALNRFCLILTRSIRVTALCTEHLPKPLVLTIGDPTSIRVMTPAKAQPTGVREVAVLVCRCIVKGCLSVKCSKANPQ